MDSTNVVTFLNTTILIEGGIGSTGVHMTIKTSSGSVTRFVGNFKFYITYVCQPAKTLGIVSLHACIAESLTVFRKYLHENQFLRGTILAC